MHGGAWLVVQQGKREGTGAGRGMRRSALVLRSEPLSCGWAGLGTWPAGCLAVPAWMLTHFPGASTANPTNESTKSRMPPQAMRSNAVMWMSAADFLASAASLCSGSIAL